MVTRNVLFAAGENYHVYNRGNSKQVIFRNPSDYERFSALLYLSNSHDNFNVRDALKSHQSVYDIKLTDKLINISAVCLMTNHFHLIATPLTDGGLSKFMLKLGTSYSMYFNTKYDRTGSLFEGSYKAKYLEDDRYLKYLFAYIHLNPQKLMKGNNFSTESIFNFVNNYQYSSLSLFTNPSSPRVTLGLDKIVDRSLFEIYFKNEVQVQRELFDWINYDDTPALG